MLFELIAERYERKSLAITANAPFSAWDEVFPDKAMTVAAVDRLVHHSTTLEMNVDSYLRRAALPARRSLAAPAACALSPATVDKFGGNQPAFALRAAPTLAVNPNACFEGRPPAKILPCMDTLDKCPGNSTTILRLPA